MRPCRFLASRFCVVVNCALSDRAYDTAVASELLWLARHDPHCRFKRIVHTEKSRAKAIRVKRVQEKKENPDLERAALVKQIASSDLIEKKQLAHFTALVGLGGMNPDMLEKITNDVGKQLFGGNPTLQQSRFAEPTRSSLQKAPRSSVRKAAPDSAKKIDEEVLIDAVVGAIFRTVDADSSDYLDSSEVCSMLSALALPCSDEDVSYVMNLNDVNHNSSVELDELFSFLYLNYIRPTPSSSSGNTGVDMGVTPCGFLVDDTGREWTIPVDGLLTIDFVGSPSWTSWSGRTIDQIALALQEASCEEESQSLFRAVVAHKLPVYTATQARQLCAACQGVGGAIGRIGSILPCLTSANNALELVSTELKRGQRLHLRASLGNAWRPMFGLVAGHYCLDLRYPSETDTAKLIALHAEEERSFLLLASHPTALNDEWENFQNGRFRAHDIPLSVAWFKQLSHRSGVLRFDYCPTSRPPKGVRPLSAARFEECIALLNMDELTTDASARANRVWWSKNVLPNWISEHYIKEHFSEMKETSHFMKCTRTFGYEPLSGFTDAANAQLTGKHVSSSVELTHTADTLREIAEASSNPGNVDEGIRVITTSRRKTKKLGGGGKVRSLCSSSFILESPCITSHWFVTTLCQASPKRASAIHKKRPPRAILATVSIRGHLESFAERAAQAAVGGERAELKSPTKPTSALTEVLLNAVADIQATLPTASETWDGSATPATPETKPAIDSKPKPTSISDPRLDSASAITHIYSVAHSKLLEIEELFVSKYILVDHLLGLVTRFPIEANIRPELIVSLFPRVVDIEHFWEVLRILTLAERHELYHRLGMLNCVNPDYLGGVFSLNLALDDNRATLIILMRKARSESDKEFNVHFARTRFLKKLATAAKPATLTSADPEAASDGEATYNERSDARWQRNFQIPSEWNPDEGNGPPRSGILEFEFEVPEEGSRPVELKGRKKRRSISTDRRRVSGIVYRPLCCSSRPSFSNGGFRRSTLQPEETQMDDEPEP